MMFRVIRIEEALQAFLGRRVAVVGGAPTCLENPAGVIDSYDVVVRVNNYKVGSAQGFRTDVFYSYFGGSIRKTQAELLRDGVKLCMCKCPDAKPIESAWHVQHKKQMGIDFRYIYEARKSWWFCDTYIPTVEHFLDSFELLRRHIPTTGFSAILDVLQGGPAELYLTGFDFFESGIHNVNEAWRAGRKDDPIGHRPDLEWAWLAGESIRNPAIKLDAALLRRLGDYRGEYL